MTRQSVLRQLADLICEIDLPHPMRIAIDGVDASGKTVLANELVPLIKEHSRPVIRASVDGFHNPRDQRYQRGPDSPVGYYLDSFDNEAITRELLIPLGPEGNRYYRRAVFDYRVNAPSHEPRQKAPDNAILLFDGVFLLRSALYKYWDYSIFVDVDFGVSVPRAVERDVIQSRGQLEADGVREKYHLRYVPGQEIYLREVNPKAVANLILVNNDLESPRVIVNFSCTSC